MAPGYAATPSTLPGSFAYRHLGRGAAILLWIVRFALLGALCHEGLSSLQRVPAAPLISKGMVRQELRGPRSWTPTFRQIGVALFLALSLLGDRLRARALRRRSRRLWLLGTALPFLFLVGGAPYFLPQVLFAVGLERMALLTIGLPLLLFLILYRRRRLSPAMLVALTMFTLILNFDLLIKVNREVKADDLLRLTRQPTLRTYLLAPTRHSRKLVGHQLVVNHDIEEIALSPDEKHLYAATANYEDSRDRSRLSPLVRIDVNTGRTDRIYMGAGIRPMVFDRKRKLLYVGQDCEIARIIVVDTRTFRVVGRKRAVMAHGTTADVDIELFLFDPGRDLLWVFHEWGLIEKWRPDPLRLVATYPGHGLHEYVHLPKTGELFTQSEGVPPGLLKFKLGETPKLTGYRLLPLTYGIAYNRRAHLLYVTDPFLGRVWIVSPRDLSLVGSFDATVGAKNIVYDHRRGLFYIGNYLNGHFYVYHGETTRLLGRVDTGKRYRRILVAPRSGRVFVATSRGVFEVDVDRLIQRR